MIPNSATLVYFSPTHTTKKTIENIALGVQLDSVEHLDLTPPAARGQEFSARRRELAIIGAPVYSGRLPQEAAERIARLQGNDTPAVVVVVYGNRAYEDALLELKDLVIQAGFIPVAGGAFVGEHSFSDETTPIAPGRPDSDDAEKAIAFGQAIQLKLAQVAGLDSLVPLQVPGNHPYKERPGSSGITPVTLEADCTGCDSCATVCPTGAITVKETVETDPNLCILCAACVKNCPSGARVFTDPRMVQIAQRLHTNCGKRQEPQTFL